MESEKTVNLKDVERIIDEFEKKGCEFCGTPKYCVDGETECQAWIDLKSKLEAGKGSENGRILGGGSRLKGNDTPSADSEKPPESSKKVHFNDEDVAKQ